MNDPHQIRGGISADFLVRAPSPGLQTTVMALDFVAFVALARHRIIEVFQQCVVVAFVASADAYTRTRTRASRGKSMPQRHNATNTYL
jgi:hypothetical protein